MKNTKKIVVGISALCMVFGLNFQHTFNDYGIVKNKLSVEVLAQTNGSGTGSGSGSGSGTGSNTGTGSGSGSGSSSGSWWQVFWSLKKTKTTCTYRGTEGASGSISVGVSGSAGGSVSGVGSGSVGGSISGSIGANSSSEITYQGEVWECYDGLNPFCNKDCRAPLD